MGTLLRKIDRILLFNLIIISIIISSVGSISSQTIYTPQRGSSKLINIVKIKDLPEKLGTSTGSIPYRYGGSLQLLQKAKQKEILPMSGTAERDLDQMPPLKSTNSEKQGFKPQSNPLGSLDVSFQGLGLNNTITSFSPPDPNLAVGSNYIVEAVNSTIAIYTETGTLVKQTSLASIFSNQNDKLGDPKIVFDQYSQRWILLALNFNSSNSQYLIAASETSDPTGQWYIYEQNASLDGSTNTGFYADYPGLGLDANAVYITSNQYAGNVFQYSKIRILLKSQLYSHQTLTYTDFTKLIDADSYMFSFTLKPAYNFDNTNSAYFLCDEEFGSNTLTYWKIDNPTSSNPQLTMTPIYISPYQQPPDAVQENSANTIDVGDCRLQDVVCRNGFLYTSFETAYNWGHGNVCAIRYEKINASTGSVAMDAVYGSDLSYYYYPNVYIDAYGNIGLVFSRSSTNEYPGVRWTYRTPDDGTARVSQSLKDGLNYYYNPVGSDNRNRWGDYSGICMDPSNSNKIWLCGEYATSYSWLWGTAIGSFTFITPITFANELQSSGSNLGGNFLVNSSPVSSGQTVNFLPNTNINLIDQNERFANNKQNNWDNDNSNYLLSRNFSAGNAYPQPSRNEIANYVPLNPATITASFPEFPSVSGLKVQFNDPWYLNSNGTQGNNFAQSFIPLTQNSAPMTGAYNQASGGVFLNQSGPTKNWSPPYYSIGSSQSISLGGTNHPFYIWYCTGTNAIFNTTSPTSVPVEFTSANSSITTYLKGSLISNNSSTFLNNSQRKFVKTSDGVLHLVYSSMGHVWYEISTNNGSSWTLMNNGHPLDNGAGKCPSIDYYGNTVAIAFQQQASGSYTYTIQLQTYYGYGSSYIFGTSATVYSEYSDAYSVNANPNISWGYNAKFIVSYERKDNSDPLGNPYGIHFVYGSLSYNNITLIGRSWISGTNNNSVNASVYSNKSDYNDGFQVAYEQDNWTKFIFYSRTNISPTWTITCTTPVNIASGDTYLVNYRPSIIGMPDGSARVCWMGDFSGNGNQINTIYRNLNNGTYYSLGYNVRSTSLNLSDDNTACYASWSTNFGGSAWSNSFVDLSNPYSTKTLNTSGQDVQISNGAGKSNMYVSAYYPFTAPYYFQTSNNLGSFPKTNPNSISSGKGVVIVKGNAQLSYSLGDVTVDNNKISFVKTNDSTNNNNLNNINSSLITEPFTLNNNSDFSFSAMNGLIDSAAALAALGNSGYIEYKTELIDDATGAVLGTLSDTKISSSNLLSDNVSSFKVNTDGLGGKTVKMRLTVNTNLYKPEYYEIERYSADGNVTGKFSADTKEISVQGSEIVKSYELGQNYPNPFNPTTIITYQIPKDGFVTVKVFDALGREIKTLVNDFKSQGKYSVNFDASSLSSGVYFYQLKAGDYTSIKKMVLLK